MKDMTSSDAFLVGSSLAVVCSPSWYLKILAPSKITWYFSPMSVPNTTFASLPLLNICVDWNPLSANSKFSNSTSTFLNTEFLHYYHTPIKVQNGSLFKLSLHFESCFIQFLAELSVSLGGCTFNLGNVWFDKHGKNNPSIYPPWEDNSISNTEFYG